MECDVLERDDSLDVLQSKTFVGSGIDRWDSVDSLEKLGGGSLGFTDCLSFGRKHSEGEGSNDDGKEDIDDDTRVGLASGDKDTTEKEGEGIGTVNGEN
jgi:hypothetical protein